MLIHKSNKRVLISYLFSLLFWNFLLFFYLIFLKATLSLADLDLGFDSISSSVGNMTFLFKGVHGLCMVLLKLSISKLLLWFIRNFISEEFFFVVLFSLLWFSVITLILTSLKQFLTILSSKEWNEMTANRPLGFINLEK